MKTSILYLLSALSFVFITSCSEDNFISDQFESESTESQVIALTSQTEFTIENTNGNILISTSDTAKNINCVIAKKVKSKISENDAQAHLSLININTTKTNSGTKIKVDHPKNDDRNYEIKFGILMPDKFNYNLNLGNGNVTINSSTCNLVINIGNGNADANIVLMDTCNVSMSIGNGSIDFKIPGETNAAVNAVVGNGSISNNGLNFQNQNSNSKKFTGTLGNGAGSIVLNIGNGSIAMRKK